MTTYESPEVRAAKGASTPRQREAPTISVHARISPGIDVLLNEMLDASEVFIVGVMPWECSRRLITLQHQRVEAGNPPPAKTVHYLVPERDAKNTGAAMAPRIQRWIAGLFGMRNWVVPNRDDSANRDNLKIYLYQYDAGGCTILVRKDADYRATSLTYIPAAGYPVEGILTVAPLDPDQTAAVQRHVLDKLLPGSRRWEIRQVRCYGPKWEPGDDANAFTPRIWRLSKERRLEPHETEPAVVVAVCGQTSQGSVVILKNRDRSNSIDDFDRLSLVSEHVIVEDLVDWIKKVPGPLDPDDVRAREQIWRAAGRPERLLLQQQFFAEAAQRELFISCGLNVDFDRLQFHGYRLVNREDGTHLGFAVFRLDLIQDEDIDELDIVEGWSSDMRPIPVAMLYQDPYVNRLNRFLRLQQGWLLANVLPKPRPGEQR
ncbi:hypothetical protein [Phytohabitans aurantiacus]|uniref:Uncharacterized protein n=1 Tax=Phytohabitans aurantiacus TaxID=3016789 RepID=A0ABQ5R1I9_9ACTN|nr:hypothetical protein [Phytohabitans aurantiacus]GLH99809.1 hypothetical protein Pa4123_50860 [Phytohabitans aurantiacus]